MPTYFADFIFDGTRLHRDHSLVLGPDGSVKELLAGQVPGAIPVEGIISPAFVNAHCHLELSYLEGQIPRHTGMAGFVERLQGIRNNFSDEVRVEAARNALAGMHAKGIAAVGDICNGPSTLSVKREYPTMYFRNFCEVFGLDPLRADQLVEQACDLAAQFGPRSAPTPHAPYSMSPRLRDLLYRHLADREVPLSLHFLESDQERALFEELEGPLFDLFRRWGLPFSPNEYDSVLDFVSEGLPTDIPLLLVHAVEMTEEEWSTLTDRFLKAYFVLCPKANEYIHGTLPSGALLARSPERVCIGTDSLAGNDTLDILAEIRLLQEQQDLSTSTLLQWATLNGARALDLPLESFRIQPGDRPILIQIAEVEGENAKFTASSHAKRLNSL